MVIVIKKFRIISIVLFILGILLNIITQKTPDLVEKYYSNGINIYIIRFMSKIFSLFPFSLFEMLIYMAVVLVLVFLIYSIYFIVKTPDNTLVYLKNSILNIISIIGIVYFLFVILWGINYNRMDLKDSLIADYNKSHNQNIKDVNYGEEDLINLYKFLVEKCNETRMEVLEDNKNVMKCNTNPSEVLKRANNGYDNVEILNLNKRGNYSPAKAILNSSILCYTGITGIYSPFTGEANVNIAAPDIYIPFTTLHEMAHQRGYSSEDECNFLAYIACINNKDYDFQYSGYILALKYTASALAKVDYDEFKELSSNLSQSVKNDLKNSNEFWSKYQGKVNEVSDKMNNNYLKANGVVEGIDSYGKVVNLFLIYYSLYGFN